MIVKVEVVGDIARLSSRPGDAPSIYLLVPAARAQSRFAERASRLVGYFACEDEGEILQLGDRIPSPKVTW
jgi:hypothetical protein